MKGGSRTTLLVSVTQGPCRASLPQPGGPGNGVPHVQRLDPGQWGHAHIRVPRGPTTHAESSAVVENEFNAMMRRRTAEQMSTQNQQNQRSSQKNYVVIP